MVKEPLKVALLNPPSGGRKVPQFENLGIGYLSAVLRRHGFSVTVVDAVARGMDAEKSVNEIIESSPGLVGISVTQPSYGQVVSIVAKLKAHWDGPICLGGHLATFMANKMLEDTQADFVVQREGEYPFLELAKALDCGSANLGIIANLTYRSENGIVRNVCRERILDLDSLPFPERDTIIPVLQDNSWVGVSSSRGCNGHCTFCTVNHFFEPIGGSAWVGRSASDVVSEIEALVFTYGARKFIFVDDNFLGSERRAKRRAFEIADALVERGVSIEFGFACRADDVDANLFAHLLRAGLSWVFIGFESGCQRVLRRFGKSIDVNRALKSLYLLRTLGIKVEPGFIMFDPETTKDDLRASFSFLGRMPDAFLFSNLSSKLEILCGSAYHRRLGGILDTDLEYSSIRYEFSADNARIHRIFCQLVEGIDHTGFESVHEESKERLLSLRRSKAVPRHLSHLLLQKIAGIKAKYLAPFRSCLEHGAEVSSDSALESLYSWAQRDIARLTPLNLMLKTAAESHTSQNGGYLEAQLAQWLEREQANIDEAQLGAPKVGGRRIQARPHAGR